MRTLLLSVLMAGFASAESLSVEQTQQLRELIKPDAAEDQWARIPWRTNLWEARQEAARLGKPILLWEMDGHPLGCT